MCFINFSVKLGSKPWECKVMCYISFFKSFSDLLLEYHQLIFHFWVYIALFICRPESPKGITNNVSKSSCLFNPKNVLSKLQQNFLPLQKLLSHFLLMPGRWGVRLSIIDRRHHDFLGIL